MSPTLNGVTPYKGVDNVQWLLGDGNLGCHKPIAQLASEFLTSPRCMYNASQILHLLVQARPVFRPRTFEKTFAKAQKILYSRHHIQLPRHIPLQILGYDVSLMSTIRVEALKRISHSDLPSPQMAKDSHHCPSHTYPYGGATDHRCPEHSAENNSQANLTGHPRKHVSPWK